MSADLPTSVPESSTAANEPKLEQAATGVSNGDVDWLFRGKSKRTKKKDEPKDTGEREDAKEKKPGLPKEAVKSDEQAAKEKARPKENAEPPKPQLKDQSKQQQPKEQPKEVAKPPIQKEQPLPKIRSRSNSDASTSSKKSTESDTKPSKRSIFSSISSKLRPEAKPEHLFGLRRKSSTSEKPSAPKAAPKPAEPKPVPAVPPSQVEEKPKCSTPVRAHDLSKIPLKRVAFAVHKLKEDPQQQIPSRKPRMGNVLVPEEILAEPARLNVGIADANNPEAVTKPVVDQKALKRAIDAQRRALIESDKHAQEAHDAAERMAKEVTSFKKMKHFTPSTKEELQEEHQAMLQNQPEVEIDKPLHEHVDYFQQQEEPSYKPEEGIPLELVYTRCCHLREILPIPATLKQLKNKSEPLAVLKMLNPKPTLIDVLSFSDFLSITPVITTIFDNVSMSTEMLKVILSSLKSSKTLEKLSLRNVAIDSHGWLYLCKFLLTNRSVLKLDISQQKIKADTPAHLFRSNMDWGLFSDTLYIRGGIDELVVNGCKMETLQFKQFITKGVSKTKRLGLAATNLNTEKCKAVADLISRPDSCCVGVDVGFNDFSDGQIKPLTKCSTSKLVFFSLNSTNIGLSDCQEMIESLSKIPTLRFLDLSNNPKLFPNVISVLREYLPLFPDLRRIHFELNELSSEEIIAIAHILPRCPQLIHVSFLGNKSIDYPAAASLYAAIKGSKIYTMDVDHELIEDELGSKMAFYLMKNMEKSMNFNAIESTDNEDDLMFDGSVFAQAAEKLLENKLGPKGKGNEKDSEYTKRVLAETVIEKASRIRKDLHDTMDKLFDQRLHGQLSLEGKEKLLRFCLLDNSLEKVVQLFEENASASVSEEVQLHQGLTEILETGPLVSPRPSNEDPKHLAIPVVTSLDQPHQVVVDSNKEGISIPIDKSTGRPVIFKQMSKNSVKAKKQEEEEGEFHRWGFFVQQQNSILPGSPVSSPVVLPVSDKKLVEPPKLSIVPSGGALREAVMRAKGIESISDLIDNISHDRVKLENIYSCDVKSPNSPVSIASTDSLHDPSGLEHDSAIDEVYDKLLNDLVKVRSNK